MQRLNWLKLKMSEIGPLLGVGREAEVYGFGELALKLYKPGVPKASAFREAAHLAIVERNGLSAPRVHAVSLYEGRWGIVMDRADGANLGESVVLSPERTRLLKTLVQIHKDIHTRPGNGFPSLKARLTANIRRAATLPDTHRRLLLQQVDDLPDGDALCHGDFHPWNVLGSVIVDWLDACAGSPAADVCRTFILLRRVDVSLATEYVAAYVSKADMRTEDVFAWLPSVAAARLAEDISSEQEDLLFLAGVSKSKPA